MSLIESISSFLSVLQECPGEHNDVMDKFHEYQSLLKSKRTKCIFIGEFSSGKSTLINSLIGLNILPVGDKPLTNVQTQISHSPKKQIVFIFAKNDKKSIFQGPAESIIKKSISVFYSSDKESELKILSLIKNSDELAKLLTFLSQKYGGEILNKVYDERHNYPQRGYKSIILSPESINKLRALLWITCTTDPKLKHLNEELNQEEKYSNNKNLKIGIKSEYHLIKIEITMPLPTPLSNLVILDVPGVGSVYEQHDIISENTTFSSPIIFQVFDVEHIGGKLSVDLFKKIKKSNALLVPILNKCDRIDPEKLGELITATKKIFDCNPLIVSSLYSLSSKLLQIKQVTVAEIADNPKINISHAILSKKWDRNNIENNSKFLMFFLAEQAHLKTFEEKIRLVIEKAYSGLVILVESELLKSIQVEISKINCYRAYSHTKEEYLQLCTRKRMFEQQRDKLENATNLTTNCLNDIERAFRTEFSSLENNIKNSISASFTLRYSQLHDDCCSEICRIMANISISSYAIAQNLLKECFAKMQRIFIDENLENCSIDPNIDFAIYNSSPRSFVRKVRLNIQKFVQQIIMNTSERPWFYFFRHDAYTLYINKQKQKFLMGWLDNVNPCFASEIQKVTKISKTFISQQSMFIVNKKKQLSLQIKRLDTYVQQALLQWRDEKEKFSKLEDGLNKIIHKIQGEHK